MEETKPARADASLNANPRFLDEDTTVGATTGEEVVLVVDGFGVVEAFVERVVGVTMGTIETGAIEVVGSTIGVVEVVDGMETLWLCVTGVVCWMKTASDEEDEDTDIAEEVVAGA